MDVAEAEDIRKRQQEYTEESYKKYLHDPDNHDGMITQPRARYPGMQSQVGEQTCGGDGIPTELFQILKDDVIRVLHSICQQIWKTQQWPQDWERSVSHSSSKEGQ